MTSTVRRTVRFSAPDAAGLLKAELPPFTALYHRPSGTTHLLTEPAPEILTALGDGPLTVGELRARLAERFDLAEEAGLSERLDELVAAGLVAAE